MNKLSLIVISLSVFLMPITFCRANSDQGIDKKKLTDLLKEIKSLSIDVSCDSLSDCEVIPFGHALCGGAEDHLIVSKKNKRLDEIRNKAVMYTDLKKDYQARYRLGIAGTCSILSTPKTDCIRSKCVKVGNH